MQGVTNEAENVARKDKKREKSIYEFADRQRWGHQMVRWPQEILTADSRHFSGLKRGTFHCTRKVKDPPQLLSEAPGDVWTLQKWVRQRLKSICIHFLRDKNPWIPPICVWLSKMHLCPFVPMTNSPRRRIDLSIDVSKAAIVAY